MKVRGIRGAITADDNTADEIWGRTRELVEEMVRRNQVEIDDIASVFITVTPELHTTYPAKAVREIPGWKWVPLMCSTEIPIPTGLENCIRIMMLVNTEKSQKEIRHAFLREAQKLRTDLS